MKERAYVCVWDARGLRASRLNDVEAGHDDADRDGHSLLQQHGWGGRDRRNSFEGAAGTQTGRGKERSDSMQALGQGMRI